MVSTTDGDIQPKTFQFHWFVTKVSRFFFQIGHKRKWTIFCKSLNKLCNFPFTSIPLWDSNTHFVFHIFIEFCAWIKVGQSLQCKLHVSVTTNILYYHLFLNIRMFCYFLLISIHQLFFYYPVPVHWHFLN